MMTQLIRRFNMVVPNWDKPGTSYSFSIMGAKRYVGECQYGHAVKLPNDASDEQWQRAEDECVVSVAHLINWI
jgi:hypothetical protein